MTEQAHEKRPYEVVVIMHPDSTLEEQKELFRKNKGIIEANKGSINSLDTWGKRNLSTPIGKLKKAHYFHSTFEAGTNAIAELERTMRINDKVLRFMHTGLDIRVPLKKYMESFKKALGETANREREREAKIQARRAAAQSGGGEFMRSDRSDRSERPERPDRSDRPERSDRNRN
jgi:small subunit ribosomal protein S6